MPSTSTATEPITGQPAVLRLPPYRAAPSQHAFLAHWRSHLYRLISAGRGYGKSDIGVVDDILNAVARYPGEVGIIWVPDYPRSVEVRERFNKHCPAELRTWNGSERRWMVRTATGGPESTVWLRSLSDEDASRSYRARWQHFDELAMIKEPAFRNALAVSAIAAGDDGRPGPITGTTTPKGRNFVWKDWVQRPTEDHIHWVAESIENPAFSTVYWQQLIDRHGYDSEFFKREYRGLFTTFVGQAFPQFDRRRHVEGQEKCPVVPAVDFWVWPRGWDFGWTAPTVCVQVQISPDEHVSIRGCKLWTETHRSLVLAAVDFNRDGDCIDPAGAYGRAREAGDPGWAEEMERKRAKVLYTRKVGETARLNRMRQALHQGKLSIDPTGENADKVIEAFETAELDNNPEKDRLREDQHPQADIIDAIGYVYANILMRDEVKVTETRG